MGGGEQPRAAEEVRVRQRRGRRRAAGRAREGARVRKWPRAWRARALEAGGRVRRRQQRQVTLELSGNEEKKRQVQYIYGNKFIGAGGGITRP